MKKVLFMFVAIVLCLCACTKKENYENENINESQTIEDVDKIEYNVYSDAKEEIKANKKLLVKFGKYEQDGNFDNGKEDIEWYVLYTKGNYSTLISKYILDCRNYNDEDEAVTYDDSSIRKWLNNVFYEEAFVKEGLDVTDYNRSTRDKVTLLSLLDIETYYKNPGFNKKDGTYDKEIRILAAPATEYAIKNGVEYDKNDVAWSYKNGSYHLLNTVDDNKKAMWVGQKGHIYTTGQDVKLNKGDGVRPVITISNYYVAEAKTEEAIEEAKRKKEEDAWDAELKAQLNALGNDEMHVEDNGETCYVHDYTGGMIDYKKYGKYKKLVFSENKIKGIYDMSKMFSRSYFVNNDYTYDDWNDENDKEECCIEEVDFTGLDTSNVRTMEGLFNCNATIKKVTFGDIDTSNVESMYKMFNECPNLEEVDFGSIDTSNVKTMRGMFFYDTNLKKVDFSKFNTKNVENFGYMFYKCLGITNLNLSNFNTSKATGMEYMFANMRNLENLDISNFNTLNVTTMSRMFYRVEKIKALNLSSFDTSNVESMNYMFYYCHNLHDLDISNFTAKKLSTCQSMFHFCNNIEKLDIHKFVNDDYVDMFQMFRYCEELKELDISGLKFSKILDQTKNYNIDRFYLISGRYDEVSEEYIYKKSGLILFDGCSQLNNVKINTSDYNNCKDIYDDISESVLKNKILQNFAPMKISITNRDIMYMDQDAWYLLLKNEFIVNKEWEYKEFFNYYEEERYNHFPNYVTSDSMLHIFHLYFDYLMKNIESNKLYDKVYNMTSVLYEKAKSQYEIYKGTDIENEAKTIVGYFAVPMRLFDDKIEVPSYMSSEVDDEINKINSHAIDKDFKTIFKSFYDERMCDHDPNYNSYFEEDYTQYKPRGHYDGDKKLETYFKVFMWYGRTDFTTKVDNFSKCALIINNMFNDENILKEYNDIKSTIYYFAGTSDDCGCEEYMDVIKKVFGKEITLSDVKNDSVKMTNYLSEVKKLKSAKINSQPDLMEFSKRGGLAPSFRMIGQTYTIDAEVYQRLIYDYVQKIKVDDDSDGYKRGLPDFLDIPASFYSKTAESILKEIKDENGFSAFEYPKYEENLKKLQKEMPSKIRNDKTDVLYVKWLKCLLHLVETENNDKNLPSYMKNAEHKKKSLETFAGSYAELKHDTILYSKQTYGCAECGEGGMDEFYDTEDIEIDNKGYVEPQLELYLSLCDLMDSMYKNFKQYDVISEQDMVFINNFSELAKKLAVISDKELRGERLTDEEYELIEGYGATIEHLIIESGAYDEYSASNRQKSKAIVADVATTDGIALELGTGNPIRIYVLVNVQGKYKICSGAAYDFYQFKMPASDRMTDIEWRTSMKFDNDLYDVGYDGRTFSGDDESEDGVYKSTDHDYHFQDWTNTYKYGGVFYTERYNYYDTACGATFKANICQRD